MTATVRLAALSLAVLSTPAAAQELVSGVASGDVTQTTAIVWARGDSPGTLTFDWLDRAIDTLGAAGLKVVLGTPTATPPRWMIDKHPDMLAVDAEGRARKFGSRRHYCFSHPGYREECRRIATLMGERYGTHPHVHAWQIDNEYACHDTTLSYSDAARHGFRDWLAQRYQSPDALNRAWGNVFWSMDYADWGDIDLPNLTVTEPNPAHILDFRRYSSDQVIAFNKVQTDALRPLTDRPLIHNYMGRELSFDHFKLGDDLDIASWDSYPIGFLSDRLAATEEDKRRYLRQGDPRAEQRARKAQTMMPIASQVNDTLGWVLVNSGQVGEGLRFLRDARSRAISDPAITYHIAFALHRLGRTEEAIAELRESLASQAAFDEREDAKSLLAELQARN